MAFSNDFATRFHALGPLASYVEAAGRLPGSVTSDLGRKISAFLEKGTPKSQVPFISAALEDIIPDLKDPDDALRRRGVMVVRCGVGAKRGETSR